jgi:hypothetical protein
MRATALWLLLAVSWLADVLCFTSTVQRSAFLASTAAKTAQNEARLRMAMSPHWQAQREALRNAFLKKSAVCGVCICIVDWGLSLWSLLLTLYVFVVLQMDSCSTETLQSW